MSELEKLNKITDEALDDVVGGVTKVINTKTDQNAALRNGPGSDYKQIRSLKNGTKVNFTGHIIYSEKDDRNWAEIDKPVHGWVAASIIGLKR